MNNKLKISIILFATLTAINSSFAGRFFIGSSGDIQYNSLKFNKDKNTYSRLENEKNKILKELNDKESEMEKYGKNFSNDVDISLNNRALIRQIKNLSVHQINEISSKKEQKRLEDIFDTTRHFAYDGWYKVEPNFNIKNSVSYSTKNDYDIIFTPKVPVDLNQISNKMHYIDFNNLQDKIIGIYNEEYQKTKEGNASYNNFYNTGKQIKDLNLRNELNNKTDKVNLANMDYTVRKIDFNISLIAGYKIDLNKLAFITEFGMGIPFSSTISSKSDSQIETKKSISLFLAQKVGYKLAESTLTYLTFGLSATKYKFSHNKIKDENKTLIQPFIGLGNEFAINQNLSLFTELEFYLKNEIKIKDTDGADLGSIEIKTQKLKCGIRYYI